MTGPPRTRKELHKLSPTWTVEHAEKVSQFEAHGNTLYKYKIRVDDGQGKMLEGTINQRPETPPPSGLMELEAEKGRYGVEFKKVKQTTSSGFRRDDPAKEKRIEMM